MPARFDGSFHCEQCGARAGAAMITCPERPQGTCPYALVPMGGSKVACMGLTLIVLGVMGLALYVGLTRTGPPAQMLILLGALILGGAGVLGILNLLSDPDSLLVNPETGRSWARITVAGRTLRTEITTPTEPIDLQLVLGRPLELPASFAAVRPSLRGLSEAELHHHAVDLVELTLLALLAEGLLSLRAAHRYRAMLSQPFRLESVIYLLEPGPRAGRVALDSVLEHGLVSAVIHWHLRDLDHEPDIRPITLGWHVPPRHGIEVRHVVRQLSDQEQLDPHQWLIARVQADAAAHGALDDSAAALRATEYTALYALYDELAHTYPDVAHGLRVQIAQGFEAMQGRL